MYPSIYSRFPVIQTTIVKKNAIFTYPSLHFFVPGTPRQQSQFSRTAAHIFVSPGDAPATITQYDAWLERQFNACQTPHSMYLSSLSSIVSELYDVNAYVQKSLFLPHFCFSWGRPWGNHAKCYMDGKRIRCLQIVLQHVSIYLLQFPSYSNRKCKNRRFHVPQPTFLFPLETPLRLSRNILQEWKDNSTLAKPLAACTYLSSTVSELYDA